MSTYNLQDVKILKINIYSTKSEFSIETDWKIVITSLTVYLLYIIYWTTTINKTKKTF